MAAAVSLSGSSITTTAGTHTVTKTATVGDLIVIAVTVAGDTCPAPTDNNADGLGTYTFACSAQNAISLGSARGVYFFVRDALIGNASSTTFTQTTAGGDTGARLAVIRLTGMSNAGAVAIVRTGSTGAAGGSTAVVPNVSWTSGTPVGTNPLLAAVVNDTNPATMTKPTLFDTELLDTGFNTPKLGVEIVSDNTGNTSATVTWASASASVWGAICLELDATSTAANITVAAASATAAAAAGVPTPKEVVLSTSATALAAAGVPGLVTPSNLTVVAEVATATADAGVPTIVGVDPNITIAATVATATAAARAPSIGRFILNPEPDASTSFLTPRLDTGLPAVFLLIDPEPAGYGGAYPSLTTYPGVVLFPGIDIFGLDLVDGTLGTLLLTPAVDR